MGNPENKMQWYLVYSEHAVGCYVLIIEGSCDVSYHEGLNMYQNIAI